MSTGPGPRRAPDKALAHRGHGERFADMGLPGLIGARLSRCPALALLAGPGRRAGGRETRGRLSRAAGAGSGSGAHLSVPARSAPGPAACARPPEPPWGCWIGRVKGEPGTRASAFAAVYPCLLSSKGSGRADFTGVAESCCLILVLVRVSTW